MKGYGKKLRDLRGSRSSRLVAKAIGISDSALRMYENEMRTPRDDTKIALADYYQVKVEDIFFTKNVT